VFEETQAIESVLVHQVTKQLASINVQVEANLDGTFDLKTVVEQGPLNSVFLLNTSLQEETVSLISTFT
jgi:hypothetical protein